jgi:hypothetical protein
MAQKWTDARARIAEHLLAVAITSPSAMQIKKVYTSPPGTVQDTPCFIIYPPAVPRNERPSGQLRKQTYVVRMRLLVKDADLAQSAELVDAFRSAVLGEDESTPGPFDLHNKLSDASSLNQTCQSIEGPIAEEAAGFTYGGTFYTGIDFLLTVHFAHGVANQA